MEKPFWQTKSLEEMTHEEWESLCDRCGKCCLRKIEEDDGEFVFTSVACTLLDTETGQCKNYQNRKRFVPDCIQLKPEMVENTSWLPVTCAYRLVFNGEDLPEWHHLKCGNFQEIHKAGMSVKGRVISEDFVGDIEEFAVNWKDL